MSLIAILIQIRIRTIITTITSIRIITVISIITIITIVTHIALITSITCITIITQRLPPSLHEVMFLHAQASCSHDCLKKMTSSSSHFWGYHGSSSWASRDYTASEDLLGEPVDEPRETALPDMSQEECALELFEMLLQLKLQGINTAKKARALAYWASQAGASGGAANLAYPPGGTSTGNYSKHFDRVVGIKEDRRGVL